ncbi:uncharacterized protein CTHT_0027210 [Thermochaetoides thermophila DSM 1495]|uniref:General alpha-glucoside permease n=1 Tax=Chaetomium thermophilum (strain DSM 1495 / CBS 144.50 / IMI 039719) TaxID=759272 RepID=G0S6X5_CHATD|nr:hypothetical protein CTHT_0027210 [Thermochaetoides thermophila DSM 1495]EGS20883.1 hypothetical protein CTHT_0027210 [Thermochaetoides thermophila DSM 1495]
MTSSPAALPDAAHPADSDHRRSLSSDAVKKLDVEQTTRSSRNGGHRQEGHRDAPVPQDGLNEQSPLLSPSSSHGDDDPLHPHAAHNDMEESQKSKSLWYLILLTIGIGGLQIAWSVELSNGSPYLLSLGMSKSLVALVWIAGPLSGTLVQPYVGMLSDSCRISWGKRKPFMIAGAAATIASLLFLAWTKEIVGGFLGLFGAPADSNFVKVSIIVVAVLFVYILDFAINTVQAAIRAFIVDCAPTHQQETANAMASRFVGIGNIVGYLAGYTNLPAVMWFFGDTQFKDLCAIASIALALTVALSCLFIRERDPRLEGPPPKDRPGVLVFFRKIFKSIRRLPPQTKKVCQVQFCAWIGFFPMLFYTSEYIAEIYVDPFLEKNPHMTPEELDKLYEDATRQGTFALLIFAIVGLATNVFLPFFIAPSIETRVETAGDDANSLKDYDGAKKTWLDYLVIPGFTLRRAWMLAQILFTICMLCTLLVRSITAGTILIGLVGITWALTLWAPWAIIGAEISRRDEIRRAQYAQRQRASNRGVTSLDGYSSDEHQTPRQFGNKKDEEQDQAGVILGIHNMAIAAPQIIATILSSIIFRIFQKPRGVPGDHSIAIVLALGGLTVFVSAFLIHTIRDDPGMPVDAFCAIEDGEVEDEDISRDERGETSGRVSSRRPSTIRSRRSVEVLPRQSLERAALVRNQSFGGMEYD